MEPNMILLYSDFRISWFHRKKQYIYSEKKMDVTISNDKESVMSSPQMNLMMLK